MDNGRSKGNWFENLDNKMDFKNWIYNMDMKNIISKIKDSSKINLELSWKSEIYFKNKIV